jgi:hypothetical protein
MNTQTSVVPSTLLRNKLGRLALRLQQQAKPGGDNPNFDTLESVVAESIKILSQFYRNLAQPLYTPTLAIADTVPDADEFNNNFQVIKDDLDTIFMEFENMEGVVVGNFNYMTSRLNRLNRKLKSTYSRMGDFILFSDLPSKDAIFFSDSFNNLARVQVHSPLLNAQQCEINQVEGIATLPIDRASQVPINIQEIPVINSNSNGRAGNNEQVGAVFHGLISDILDNNADTWFEYERVVSVDDGVPLVFDFTINLGEAKIINFVRINPNNFGTRTPVEVLNINTSVDGREFVSVKDDIPLAGFITEDEDNVFLLAPNTSKFAGQGLYTFTPRKAKYLHITLKQSTPYLITTSRNVEKWRYAIGVRDIEIQALPYQTKGEVVSTEFVINDDVSKVVVLSNQSPDAASISTLASIQHYVSPDNGQSWYQIRPRSSAGLTAQQQEVPEILDFNGVTPGSIQTDNEVRTLRYKAVMERFPDAFVDNSPDLAQEIGSNTELHPPPQGTPFSISLENSPLDDTLRLIDPQFGSRGKEDVKYQIATGTGGKVVILLPFRPLARDFEKTTSPPYELVDKAPERVYVDGELWTAGLSSSSAAVDKKYRLNYEEGRLEFGDDTIGKAVPQGSTIAMTLGEERLFPTRGTDHIAKLDYTTSNDKGQAQITIVQPATTATAVLKKGALRHQLNPYIVPESVQGGSLEDINEQVFQDGSVELTDPDHWSVDYVNGLLYLKTPTDTTLDFTITYRYHPHIVLSQDDWEFIDTDEGIADAVSIADPVFQTFPADTIEVPSGVRYFNVEHLAVVRGTMEFFGPASGVFDTEVEYIDGRSELLGVVHATEPIAPMVNVGPGGERRDINFSLPVTTDTTFSVTFTNRQVFANQVTTSHLDVDSPGEYFIDRINRKIYVWVASDVRYPGNVDYYYRDPQANLSGRYSVNYHTGEVFTFNVTPDSDVTVRYEYTDMRMKYDIARLVPQADWGYDSGENKITIKDREILKNVRTPQASGSSAHAAKYYQVTYQYVKKSRADVKELEPFFSPVLKDYALKVITRSRLT